MFSIDSMVSCLQVAKIQNRLPGQEETSVIWIFDKQNDVELYELKDSQKLPLNTTELLIILSFLGMRG